MAYADYEFYATEYGGNIVSEDAFGRLSIKASDKLDYLSNYRVPRYLDSIVTESERDIVLTKLIKKATCWLAEAIMDVENAEIAQRQSTGVNTGDMGITGKIVKTISAGSESITYESAKNVMTEMVGNKKTQNKYYFDGIREYLGGTGLLSQIL